MKIQLIYLGVSQISPVHLTSCLYLPMSERQPVLKFQLLLSFDVTFVVYQVLLGISWIYFVTLELSIPDKALQLKIS